MIRKHIAQLRAADSKTNIKDRKLKKEMVKPGQIHFDDDDVTEKLFIKMEKAVLPYSKYGDSLKEKIPKKSKIYLSFKKSASVDPEEKKALLAEYLDEMITYLLNFKIYSENKIFHKTETEFLNADSKKEQIVALRKGIKSMKNLAKDLKQYNLDAIEKRIFKKKSRKLKKKS